MTDDTTPVNYDDLADREQDVLDGAPRAAHQLTVTLSTRAGLDYGLQCLGNEKSQCHLWRDDENAVGTLGEHADCAILEWFNWDQRAFVEEGYVGPPAPALTSGRIRVSSWGEDGCEWEYEKAEATEWPVGSLA